MQTNQQNKYSKLHHYVDTLALMLVEIAELESELDICMTDDSKAAFKSDLYLLQSIANKRIQSIRSKNYALFLTLYGKIENYMFSLRKMKQQNAKSESVFIM